MTLIEIISNINSFDEDHTIYVSRPWSSTANAVVCQEPEDGTLPTNAIGMEYFIEVFLLIEFLEDWKERKGKTLEEVCDRIINYAENDI